ncbi:MAG: 1-deoxy-D-xylulose-5-phosphate synthase [Actinomycetia bacterium]|nr:1-deoxy-D-xylulose-5-phosphate synthase [Actinomycetes bacterium]
MSLLAQIVTPADVQALDPDELKPLASEIRDFLVENVSRTGGHLGPNLGVVELTIALHRVFDSPRDVLLWDTGHQAYVHKLLTGRHDFASLRKREGLSGYPSRTESEHDVIENSHASTALSYADGIAKGFQLRGEQSRTVVAVVGDGALTGGMAWEALNNLAAVHDRPVVIVVNDNERSYAPTIGGLAHHLATLRTTRGYEKFLGWGRTMLGRTPVVGQPLFDALHGMKKGLKDMVAPQGLFEDLGLKYVGPVDGHDVVQLEHALRRAKAFRGPVIVHALTRKGLGYAPAENDDADHFHGVGVIDPETGRALSASGPTWTGAFSDAIVEVGHQRADIVAITAAMLRPVGLRAFAEAFPDRVFDVGIAEQHAVTSAAGLAYAGMHPVVAVYATFLNRAYDQVLMDVALHRAGVTFVLDRAGVTGDDGASHNGMWDLSLFQTVPGLQIAAPRDGQRLRELFAESVAIDDGPTLVRYPKGALPAEIETIDQVGRADVLHRSGPPDVLIVAVGPMAGCALDVAQRLDDQGIGVTVVDPRWVLPVSDELVTMSAGYRLVVTVEDNLRVGGVGATFTDALQDAQIATPVHVVGLPRRFLEHATRAEVMSAEGLTAQQVARAVVERVSGLSPLALSDEDEAEPPASSLDERRSS